MNKHPLLEYATSALVKYYTRSVAKQETNRCFLFFFDDGFYFVSSKVTLSIRPGNGNEPLSLYAREIGVIESGLFRRSIWCVEKNLP